MSQDVSRSELAKIIADKTLSGESRDKLISSLSAYFASQNKAVDLSSLARDVMQYRLEAGYVEAIVVSAHELNKKVMDDIKSLLRDRFPEAKTVTLGYRQDESLVGGVRIELPQESLDLSVRSKLNRFKRLVAERN